MSTLQQIHGLPAEVNRLRSLTTQSIVPTTYINSYREYLRLRQQESRLVQESIRLERQAIYGKTLGNAAYHGARLVNSGAVQTASRLTQRAAESAYSHAMRGFQGTVEWNRLQTEIMMISRELAGALKPAIDLTVHALREFRHWLESLSPRQQNLLALGVGSVAANQASKSLLGVGLGGVGYKAGQYLYRTAAGAGAAATGTAARGIGTRIAGLGLRLAGRIALPIGVALASYDAATSGDYGYYRNKGNSRLWSGAKSLWHGATMGAFRGDRDDMGSGSSPSARNEEHRRVMIADAGFEKAGSAYERLTNALALRDSQDAGTDTRDVLTKIYDFLVATFGDGEERSAPTRP